MSDRVEITAAATVWLPSTPPRPAPPLLTAKEVALLLRIDSKSPIRTINYYREKGFLQPIQIGRNLLWRLEDVLGFMRQLKDESPR